MKLRHLLIIGMLSSALAVPGFALSDSAEIRYREALAKEQALRAAAQASATEYEEVVRAYEAVVRRYPTTGYSDNALWQAAGLVRDLFARTGDPRHRERAVRFLRRLVSEYPSSKLVPAALVEVSRLAAESAAVPSNAAESSQVQLAPGSPQEAKSIAPASPARPSGQSNPGRKSSPDQAPDDSSRKPRVTVRAINRVVLPEVVRIIVELDTEVPFHHERIENPSRVFVDFRGTQPAGTLREAVLAYDDDIVRKVRVGRHPPDTTRVVLDVENLARYSLFTLYEPFRLVIDCERTGSPENAVSTRAPAREQRAATNVLPATQVAPRTSVIGAMPVPKSTGLVETVADHGLQPAIVGTRTSPSPPSSNTAGGFSIARQLGLGASRIVIDPGHGGHDPGAIQNGVSEAELVLDIALRLEQLLLKQPATEVVLTRRSDTYVALEERTAIANREGADLFLSIHANASRNTRARGVETYFLNFATTADAEAVAARENATSSRTMNSLADIIRAITLNNKRDESRDFADLVQRAVVQQLGTTGMRDLGVKQAPFVVLIGAQMPSILAEVAFITNRLDQQLLMKPAYRQRIAEALLSGVLRYRQALKTSRKVAQQ